MAPAAGLVVTALHVVEEMRAPRVAFADGRSFDAHVVESDKALDLALLEIPPQRRSAPVLGDATALRPGEEVYAIGYPRRLGFTVSRGIVSFVGRVMEGTRWIQTDLPINDGNSGGPVVNARGELVGMMSFILRKAQGISFALPANYAAERFPRLHVADDAYLERFRRWRGVELRAEKDL
jgi:S1-C subfamily serine protease